jgi:hypothetical protein
MSAARSARRAALGRLWPAIDYYEALRPQADEAHPVDETIDRTPPVRRTYRQVLALERRVRVPAVARPAFVRYCDARLLLQSLRENIAFNVGIEIGTLVGRRDALKGGPSDRAADARVVRLAARGLMLDEAVAPKRRLLTFLEMAWSLARGPADITSVAAMNRAASTKRRRRR